MDRERLVVKQILNGNKKAFYDLVENYKRLVSHIVYTNVKDQDDRDDLCQEIFLKVYINLSSFKFRSKLSTWIGKIAHNSCLNFFYKKNILIDSNISKISENDETFSEMEFLSSNEDNPDVSVYKRDLSNILGRKLLELPDKYQTAITLYHLDELSYREISEILNLSIDNIKIILYRARKMLKEKILNEFRKEDL